MQMYPRNTIIGFKSLQPGTTSPAANRRSFSIATTLAKIDIEALVASMIVKSCTTLREVTQVEYPI